MQKVATVALLAFGLSLASAPSAFAVRRNIMNPDAPDTMYAGSKNDPTKQMKPARALKSGTVRSKRLRK